MESKTGPTYLGTTPPVSYSEPTRADLQINEDLCSYLKDPGFVYETEEGQAARCFAVEILTAITTKWVELRGAEKKVSPEYLEGGGGVQLRIYGSQRLGVHSPTADIGTVIYAAFIPCCQLNGFMFVLYMYM